MNDPLRMIDDYLEGDLSPEEVRELEAWIKASPENAAVFADKSMIHARLFETAGAVASEDTEHDAGATPAGYFLQRAHGGRAYGVLLRYAAAAVFLIVAALAVALMTRDAGTDTSPHTAARDANDTTHATLTDVSDAVWARDDTLLHLGATLSGGRLRLKSGSAELLMQSTASVTLIGDTDVEVVGPNRCRLNRGRLFANVPETAHGFTVETPTHTVIDLGTRFGVEVGETGAQVHVFEGRVAVTPVQNPAKPVKPDTTPFTVVAGHARRLSADGEPVAIAMDRERFGLPVPAAIPLSSTGEGLKRGERDPNWTVATTPDVYRPAVVAGHEAYIDTEPHRAQWLSDRIAGNAPADARYVFRTSFDMSGFRPDHARLRLRFAVDNKLVDVRLNGRSFTPPPQPHAKAYATWVEMTIADGFIEGRNVLEFEVANAPVVTAPRNPISLLVELSGVALPSDDTRR